MKEGKGDIGWELVQGAWTSENALYDFIPEHVPRPISHGHYMDSDQAHFFLAEFIDMIDDDIPSPESYMAGVAALHNRSMGRSPTGKFGFAVNTRFGDLEQYNWWNSSWENFWTEQMKQFLDREEKIRGPHSDELVRLKDIFINRALPRYLRPLESDGRSIKPCLLHGDLWPGNVKYKLDNETVCIYDASALWGHNEGTRTTKSLSD